MPADKRMWKKDSPVRSLRRTGSRTIRKKYVVLPTDLSRLRHLPEAVPQRDTPLRLYMGMRRRRRREAEDEQ